MSPTVAQAFDAFPKPLRPKLKALRKLIFKTAAATEGVGELTETLKWGQPAYLTSASKSGSTIRIGWLGEKSPNEYAMYFHCQTTLVATFRSLFPEDFRFEGNRAILFDVSESVPLDSLAFCIEAALTYHLNKKIAARR